MTSNIVRQDIASLLDGWIEAERNGVLFPVPLHEHWSIAGHKYKKNAFELVESLLEKDLDFLPSKVNSAGGGIGRSQKGLMLSVSALEHLCMAAHTEQGRNVRELYRQAKAKWDIVKAIAPKVAQEVEILNLKIELAKIEAQKAALEDKTISLRHYVVTALPKPTADRILGVTEIVETEYIDRTILPSGQVNSGVGITYLQKRYGFKSTKEAWAVLDSVNCGKGSDIWRSQLTAVESSVIDRGILSDIDALVADATRQKWMGESS